MTSFLSLDLDYWGNTPKKHLIQADNFLKKLFLLGQPIKIFSYHDHILDFLNQYEVNHLYQIDYHSDLADEVPKPLSLKDLNEGTWANFFQYKDLCTFEWRYPDYDTCFLHGSGRCDTALYWNKAKFPYKKVIRKQGLSNIDFASIQAIGIALSRDWWHYNDMEPLVEKYRMEEYM